MSPTRQPWRRCAPSSRSLRMSAFTPPESRCRTSGTSSFEMFSFPLSHRLSAFEMHLFRSSGYLGLDLYRGNSGSPETAPGERPTRHCWGLLPRGYFARAPPPREIISGRQMSARNVSSEDKLQDTFHKSALWAKYIGFKKIFRFKINTYGFQIKYIFNLYSYRIYIIL